MTEQRHLRARENFVRNTTPYSRPPSSTGTRPAGTVLLFVLGDDFSKLNAPKGRPTRVGRVLAYDT
jgi:hypothetical protein